MELKNENTDALKTKLHRTKRIMQALTWTAIITLGFFIYGWISKDVGIDSSLSLIVIALSFIVIMLDKKYKKIKTELDSRN